MRRILIWGFNRAQAEALKKIFSAENFRAEIVGRGESEPSLRGYSAVVCNLDNEKVINSKALTNFNEEFSVLVGICSASNLRKIPEGVSKHFFDILKKPLYSSEIKAKVKEISQVIRLMETARVNSVLFESFDSLIDLYSYDDPYRVMERLLEVLVEELDARGAVGWIKGVELTGKFILAAACGEVDMNNEPSTVELDEILPDVDFPRNELLETDSKGVRAVSLFAVLDFQGDVQGVVKVFVDYSRYDPIKVRGMQAILRIGAAAVHSTSRLERIRRTQLIDTHMRVYNLSFFRDYLDKEIQKAHRFGRVVSVLFVEIENFAELKKMYKPSAVQETINKMLMKINSVVRSADVVSKLRDDRYAIVLSETDYYGALTLKKRLLKAFWAPYSRRDGRENDLPLKITVAEASYPRDGFDYASLLDVGAKKIEHIKTSIYSRLKLDDKPFFDSVDEVYGFVSMEKEVDENTRFIEVEVEFLTSLKMSFIRELVKNSGSRGVLYVGADRLRKDDPFSLMHHQLKNVSTTVYLMTGEAHFQENIAPVVPIIAGPDLIKGLHFLLYMGEMGTYCIFLKEKSGGTLAGFHSIDSYLIENLAVKIEDSYIVERGI